MAFTYDVTTNRGKVRLLIADTNASSYTFEDAEIDAFLGFEGNNVYLAAARAFNTIVRDRSLLSKRVQRDGFTNEAHAIADLLAIAKQLEDEGNRVGGIQTQDFELSDEHFESYRPGWRTTTTEILE